jgi:hypothetical protein
VRLRVSCFGKLPFHREFLRVGLESDAAADVVRWVEHAHEVWTRAGTAPAESPLVRFATLRARSLVAGVVRQSSDGLRKHPVALFAECPFDDGGRAAHLVPVACEPVWTALAELLGRDVADVAGWKTVLEEGVPAPDVEAAGAAYARLCAEVTPGNAWLTATGADADTARHIALNLIAIAQAQREARSAAEGVAFAVPVGGEPGSATSMVALWIEMFGAAVTPVPRVESIVIRPDPVLVMFYRPPDGSDLAAVLTTIASAPIDDLRDAWQAWPPDDARVRAWVTSLLERQATPFGALVEAVRTGAAA